MDARILNFLNSHLKEGHTLSPLTGDAGTRQYFKVLSNADENLLLCVYKQDELQSYDYFLNIQKMLLQNKIRAPKVLQHNRDLAVMLIENFGADDLETAYKASKDISLYKKSIETLIHLQELPKSDDSIAHSYSFDIEKFNQELSFALKHLQELYKFSFDEGTITKEFNSISQYLVSLPQVFTHRDFHSRNILIDNNEICLIDFQDARLGPFTYDLVSLIEDTYTHLPLKEDLKNYYLKHSDLDIREVDFKTAYYTQAIQRSVKACGSFASLMNIKATDRYLQYLSPSFQNILSYLDVLTEYSEIRKLIEVCAEKHKEIYD